MTLPIYHAAFTAYETYQPAQTGATCLSLPWIQLNQVSEKQPFPENHLRCRQLAIEFAQ